MPLDGPLIHKFETFWALLTTLKLPCDGRKNPIIIFLAQASGQQIFTRIKSVLEN